MQGNPTSNCNSPSSDKENNDSNASPKKWVPPKVKQNLAIKSFLS